MPENTISSLDMVSADEAATILNIRPQTLAIWRCTGRYSLPFIRVGRRIMYSRRALDKWTAGRTGTSTTQLEAALTA